MLLTYWRDVQKMAAVVALAAMASVGAAAGPRVLVYKEGVPTWVEQAQSGKLAAQKSVSNSDAARNELLRAIVQQQLDATAPDADHALFPTGTALDEVVTADGVSTVSLTIPDSFFTALDSRMAEDSEHLKIHWQDHVEGLSWITLLVRPAGTDAYRIVQDFLPPPPPKISKPSVEGAKSESDTADEKGQGQPGAFGQGQPTGALTGASIFVNPSHGWFYSTTLNRWATQRGNNNNLIEDLGSPEACLQYLIPYLWNAGARVYVMRERDMNTNMVIVDNGGAGHSETGTWATETVTTAYGGAHRRATTVTGAPTATSTFTPNIPAAGYYAVYVWYRPSTSATPATTAGARFTINHSGGSTQWVQNQTQDGYTWKYIGHYYFEAGSNAATGSVVLSNQASTGGQSVIADAVRFGGGMGSQTDPNDPAPAVVSGKPRWEESGRYYPGFMGKTNWASFGTVDAMPNYAEWEHESWEAGKSIYFTWHTNGGGGTGTDTFAYASSGTFNGVAKGDQLRNYIHDEVINDIRAGWNAGWVDRGKKLANFGELNPNNNNAMPAALIEVGFHDTVSDAQALLDPNFRRIASRAVYQGIVKFYRNQMTGFTNSTLLPEPPTHLRVSNNGSGAVNLAWTAPASNSGNNLLGDPATGYKVYRSTNGKGFDNGTATASASLTVNGLTAGQVYYFRVTATNAGGESFPTETLAVRVQASGAAPVLIVNGFDRLDRFANIVEDDPHDADPVHRGYLNRMNTYDYSIAHAKAIRNANRYFDSCSNEAVESGNVNLANYPIVVWICGEDSTIDESFSSAEQTQVTNYLGAGGKLFVSGSELGWDLEAQSGGLSFFQNTLRADYLSDDANTYSTGAGTGALAGLASMTFDNGTNIYNADSPDTIQAIGGSSVCLTYSGGAGAGIQYSGVNGSKIVLLAFPFETITSTTRQDQLMNSVMTFFTSSSVEDALLY